MSRFVIGLLLGLLLGIAGASAFLITAGGGDYLIVSSPHVRELETKVKQAEQERQWLVKRLDEFSDLTAKLESRFLTLASRFDALSGDARRDGAAVVAEPPAGSANARQVPPVSGARAPAERGRAAEERPRTLDDGRTAPEDIAPTPSAKQ